MPIYLAPLSRRQFLHAAAVATAGMVSGCGTMRGDHRDPNSLALLSDPHIDADPARVARGINMTRHFEVVSAEITSLANGPGYVLINGDLAYNSGQPGDYQQFGKLLQPLRVAGFPLYLALGNHDHRERFWEGVGAREAIRRPVADKQTLLLATPRANWFILDSLYKTSTTPGMLGQEQLDWLAAMLDANPRKPAVVMLHHNPGIQENMGLLDTAALLDVIRPRKQVKAYVYGHTHAWKITRDESGIHLINLPPVAYVFRESNPAGWVHATVRKDSIRLELRCVNQEHSQHGEVQDLTWRT